VRWQERLQLFLFVELKQNEDHFHKSFPLSQIRFLLVSAIINNLRYLTPYLETESRFKNTNADLFAEMKKVWVADI
jgi:hypothetical protein